jgi:hypothetical protein
VARRPSAAHPGRAGLAAGDRGPRTPVDPVDLPCEDAMLLTEIPTTATATANGPVDVL